MKFPCYTTRTGIRIGSRYDPPLTTHEITQEEYDIQSVLLGDKKHDWLTELLVAVGALLMVSLLVTTVARACKFIA